MKDSSARPGPLAGLRVLDASRVLAGPFCGMLLGDFGADVVKIERPGSGDETRRWGPPFVGDGSVREATYYLSVNRNKRSLTLDLHTASGREILHRLASRADIFIQNFRPGSEAALGADYETLDRVNPRLIYCAISGFGHTGPDRLRLGYDLLMQGFTGLMSITGEAGRPPVRVGVAMVDLATGAFAFGGILAALHARGVTGRGQRVDLSLLSTGVAWMTYAAQHYFATGEQPQPSGSGHPSLAPYQAFQGSDEKWFVVAVGTDGQFRRLCGVLEIPLAEDPRFATNADRVSHRDELVRELTRRFMSRPAAEWVARLDRAEVPAAPVHEMREVFAHPQVRALGLYAEVPHPAFGSLATVGSAFSFSETPPSLHLAPPMLGQHTAELLTELGYSEAEIARLEAEGAI
jgi:crotonobetainyl-CoA:carnitine CoA-transferase CaiB-like acyl-CoA transferase